ncbi:MAG: hypothetical protein ACFFG0_26890, partial [Candidatus Thorarchaeota archaeon]
MLNLKEFQNNLVLESIVDKLNKFLSKNNTQKVIKVVEELESLLEQSEHAIPITYILSILAEHDADLIPERIIQKVEPFLDSDNVKLRINSIIIIGFALLANKDSIKRYFNRFAEHLIDQSDDTRDNVHFFLLEIVKRNPILVNSIKDIILKSLSIEQIKENILSLFNLLGYCKNLGFNQLYHLRNISKSIISSNYEDKPEIVVNLLKVISQYFPDLKENRLDTLQIDDILDLIDKQFLMKKYNYTKISKSSNISLKGYINKIRKSELKDERVILYIKTKTNLFFVYELEKSKLLNFFEKDLKISSDKIQDTFSQIIQDDSELKIFIQTLLNLKIIKGYYSNLGMFYSYNYIKSILVDDLTQKGIINLKKYNYLPPQFIRNIIKDIRYSQKDMLLLGKNKN